MTDLEKLHNAKIAVIIPYYNAANHILKVIESMPSYVDSIILVNDCSKDKLPKEEILNSINKNCVVFFEKTPVNLGVGGATKVGFNKSLSIKSDYTIKVDADNQMDLSYLPSLLIPLINNEFEVVKGNRFNDLKALKRMPIVRRFGNLVLSFLIKMATGYWNNFDPTNGFFAIKNSTLNTIEIDKLSNRYYFETSLISRLYFEKASIKDVSMPAIYNDEESNMKVWKMPFLFIKNLTVTFVKRILKEYFLYNFNVASLFIIVGFPLFLFGVIYGVYSWWYYSSKNIFAPTGTIMLITLTVILGFQLLLQAIQYDVANAPKNK